jgi:hypothetical protein
VDIKRKEVEMGDSPTSVPHTYSSKFGKDTVQTYYRRRSTKVNTNQTPNLTFIIP